MEEEIKKNIMERCLEMPYSVGIHGISKFALQSVLRKNFRDITPEDVDKVVENIKEEGLKLHSGHTYTGTVSVEGRTDEKINFDNLFDYGYHDATQFILTATPIEIRNSSGESIYIGQPNARTQYKTYMQQGRDKTCVADAVCFGGQDEEKNDAAVPSNFILGSFSKDDNGKVNSFEFNKNHMSFNQNIVSDEYFDTVKERIENLYGKPILEILQGKKDINEIEKTMEDLKLIQAKTEILDNCDEFSEIEDMDYFDNDFSEDRSRGVKTFLSKELFNQAKDEILKFKDKYGQDLEDEDCICGLIMGDKEQYSSIIQSELSNTALETVKQYKDDLLKTKDKENSTNQKKSILNKEEIIKIAKREEVSIQREKALNLFNTSLDIEKDNEKNKENDIQIG